MSKYLELMRSTIPSLSQESFDLPFEEAGVDSFDLLSLRVALERERAGVIPDKDWLSFRSARCLLTYCESPESVPSKDIETDTQGFSQRYVVNMPQMALHGLSENWLFKEAGNAHWDRLSFGLNKKSSQMCDELGNRLYATFVRVRIQSEGCLQDFEENDRTQLSGTLHRYGNGLYFSQFDLHGEREQHVSIDLISSFSMRESSGNRGLVKSQPASGHNKTPELGSMPKFGLEYKSVKKKDAEILHLGGHSFPTTDRCLHKTTYKLNPYYDMNGVGLVYFAAYPIVSDVCEAQVCNEHYTRQERWEEAYSTSSRDVYYFANCDLGDTIEYRLNSLEIIDQIVKTSCTLVRASDQQVMARIFTVKRSIV